jgi:hypothetical protein
MGSQFPTTVCELTVPLPASDAVLERTSIRAATVHPANRRLPLPKWTSMTRPGKIAVIGDAGCEVPTTGLVQNCANHRTGPSSADRGQLIGMPLQAVHKSITAKVNPAGGVGVFGYAVLEGNGGTWKLAFHDTAGAVRGETCALSASKTHKSFACH